MWCIHITVKKIHDRVKEVNALLSFAKYNDNFHAFSFSVRIINEKERSMVR